MKFQSDSIIKHKVTSSLEKSPRIIKNLKMVSLEVKLVMLSQRLGAVLRNYKTINSADQNYEKYAEIGTLSHLQFVSA